MQSLYRRYYATGIGSNNRQISDVSRLTNYISYTSPVTQNLSDQKKGIFHQV